MGGPALTYYVTPTEEELFKKYNPDLQKKSLENRDKNQAEFNHFVDRLKEYSKSDKPSKWLSLLEGGKWRDLKGRSLFRSGTSLNEAPANTFRLQYGSLQLRRQSRTRRTSPGCRRRNLQRRRNSERKRSGESLGYRPAPRNEEFAAYGNCTVGSCWSRTVYHGIRHGFGMALMGHLAYGRIWYGKKEKKKRLDFLSDENLAIEDVESLI